MTSLEVGPGLRTGVPAPAPCQQEEGGPPGREVCPLPPWGGRAEGGWMPACWGLSGQSGREMGAGRQVLTSECRSGWTPAAPPC